MLPCLPWRIECVVLGFVSGLRECKFGAPGQIDTPWWTAVAFVGKGLLVSWVCALRFHFLERSCQLGGRLTKWSFLIAGICVGLAQKTCFFLLLQFLAQPATWRRQDSSSPCFKRPWTIFCCSVPFTPPFWWTKDPKRRMRQLRGKPKKETSKDKKERKQAMQEARQQITTVVLPTLAVVVLLIVLFVYVATRPNTTEWCGFSDFLAVGYSQFYQEPKGTLPLL